MAPREHPYRFGAVGGARLRHARRAGRVRAGARSGCRCRGPRTSSARRSRSARSSGVAGGDDRRVHRLRPAAARRPGRARGRSPPRPRASRRWPAVLVFLGHTTPPQGGAQVTLADVPGTEPREAVATVRFDPPNAADDPDWLYAIAWQGGEPLRVEELTEIGPGVYRDAADPGGGHLEERDPPPARRRDGLDPAVRARRLRDPGRRDPGAGFASSAPFVDDRPFLQRERKEGVAGLGRRGLRARRRRVHPGAADRDRLLRWCGSHAASRRRRGTARASRPPPRPPRPARRSWHDERRDVERLERLRPGDTAAPDFEVAIIGAGISGLGMGAALLHAGIDDFVDLRARRRRRRHLARQHLSRASPSTSRPSPTSSPTS